jgi:enoyl-CoA hydratase/carnithine racemase
MLLETHTAWVEADGRIATLWLNGATVADVGRAVAAVRDDPFLEILVVRSARPTGFAVATPFLDDRYEFAHAGRRVLRELEELPIPTLAFIEGPCAGPGLELALACDYRLAVATPDAWLALGDSPCWGGTARLRELVGARTVGTVTAREAKAIGLVDHAFCQRRAKIELRTWLDRLEDRPRKRRRPWLGWRRRLRLDAAELEAFVTAPSVSVAGAASPCLRRGLVVELRGCPQAVPFAVEYVLRGGTVVTDDPEAIGERLTGPLLRGRATPLEREQARTRVKTEGRGNLIFEAESADPFAVVRATLRPHARPVRVGFPLFADSPAVELTPGSATAAIAELFASAGFAPAVVPDSPRLPARARFAAVADEAVRLVADGFPIELIDDVGRAVTGRPPLRALDELGTDTVVSLVPRVRPFAAAGLRRAFYHADRPAEANALAQAMLGGDVSVEEDEREDAELAGEIERRLRDAEGNADRVEESLPLRRAA